MLSNSGDRGEVGNGPGNIPRLRSCTYCRGRKAKCDRQQPCSSCLRAGQPSECTFPAGKGRSAKRLGRANGKELIESLSRLEGLMRRLENQGIVTPSLDRDTSSPTEQGIPLRQDTVPFVAELNHTSETSGSTTLDQHLGRLVIDETRSYYISNILWANLSSEIEELHNMLAEPEPQGESYKTGGSTGILGPNAAIFGFRALTYSLESFHLPLSQSVALLRIFTDNVLPLVHIFHMPTTNHIYWDAIASLDTVDRNTEALVFSIYYSAFISIDQEVCVALFNTTRKALLAKYRFAVEQAIARANLLNTQSIILLQAVVLYLSVLRHEDDSRTAWSLTSLVFHIAQSMGLHRDGMAFGLKPLEIELRRRLWYQICLLDNQSSEYHGYETIVHEFVFDTRLPLHINDLDLTPEMTKAPPERDEACEMTFSLIRCEADRITRKIHHMPPSARFPGRPVDTISLEDKRALVEELRSSLQLYLRHCDANVPFQTLSSTVARLIIARSWLVIHFPLGRSSPAAVDTDLRDQLFSTSIEVLELSYLLLTDRNLARWTWHSKSHVQWHAIALVLSEISSRPPSPLCDRAWQCVCTVYDEFNLKDGENVGTLSRPIKRLMAKARYVREVQNLNPRKAEGLNISSPGDIIFMQPAIDSNLPSSLKFSSMVVTTGTDESGMMDTVNIKPPSGMGFLGPFPELFLPGWDADLFDIPQENNLGIPSPSASNWM
ncbi:hypothetical protein TruAng_006758 [Truncatella angustata]|nr:hypothetical protein TruAng_006758 [Truncatella angustata]